MANPYLGSFPAPHWAAGYHGDPPPPHHMDEPPHQQTSQNTAKIRPHHQKPSHRMPQRTAPKTEKKHHHLDALKVSSITLSLGPVCTHMC